MSPLFWLVLVAALAYLVGSIPVGYLAARWRGVNILEVGSGNVGATNVGRLLGWRWGLLVFFLDFAKGALPALVGRCVAESLAILPDVAAVTAGVAAFLGHLLPVFLRFRGGKGVATGAGVVLVLAPAATAVALAVWFLVVVASRCVSLASLTAATALLAARLFETGDASWAWPHSLVTGFCLLAALLVFARHRANLQRLLQGRENRLPDRPLLFAVGKMLHVLAVGLWFGMTVFFTFVVGLSLFRTFEHLSVEPRPLWLPLPPEFAGPPPSPRFPDPLRKEQGSRIAGAAVGPIFHWYYLLQLGCAAVAGTTALGWAASRTAARLHRVRAVLLVLALGTVLAGWWLDRIVAELRATRNDATDAVLLDGSPPPHALLIRAEDARASFAHWHLASLFVNFATIALVAAAMTLCANLPVWQPEADEKGTDPATDG